MNFSIYNGYDLFNKTLNDLIPLTNVAASVSTREIQVRHKVKLSKAARRNQQLRAIKKKPAVVVMKKGAKPRKAWKKK